MSRVSFLFTMSVVMFATLVGCKSGLGEASVAATQAEPVTLAMPFRATGNEPAWRLDIGLAEMILLTDVGQRRSVASAPMAQSANGTTRYVARTAEGEMVVSIADRRCKDSMTGMPYPYTVTVGFKGEHLAGCGGDPATLLHGAEWVVETITGVAVIKNSRVTLSFDPDGRVAGNASCNRYMGQCALTGENLTIAKGASTRMMCETAFMEQECAFLDALGAVRAFDLTGDGVLVLTTADDRAIRARRN